MSKMKYVRSAVLPRDYPPADRPEIAVAGRSNAGKSSFLNVLAGSKVARVSQEPGKTRLLNFFDFGLHYRFVDMPGYGFAARSGDEMVQWTQMIENYLSMRGNLKGLLLLMDVRRDWSEDEELLKSFCARIGKPLCVVLTKTDKLSRSEISKRVAVLKKESQMELLFPISSQTKAGIDELEEFVFQNWILNKSK